MSTDGGLRPLFRTHLPHLMWTTIETGGTGRGISDSHYLMRGGVEGWIEYKQTDGYAVTLSEWQEAWIGRRVRYGGRTWIALRRWHDGGPRRGAPVDELWLIPGRLAALARAGGLTAYGVAPHVRQCGAGGPAAWNWPLVDALITS